ncbi:hypothetical protein PanWU01x14_190200 [Parasponia andersonii]|uniref:Uncharacterized protein n=1 Tax=Parasponia andersonii TaxID=3476 RepID=A0A2P5C222_PARAD|nr:hypothetical protein PanWU01x14_190200 [Parasponia andersonii]
MVSHFFLPKEMKLIVEHMGLKKQVDHSRRPQQRKERRAKYLTERNLFLLFKISLAQQVIKVSEPLDQDETTGIVKTHPKKKKAKYPPSGSQKENPLSSPSYSHSNNPQNP